MKSIILIGAFLETIELCEKCGYTIIGIVDSLKEDSFYGYPLLGNDIEFISKKEKYKDFPLVIVPDHPSIRQKIYTLYSGHGFSFETIIAPDAHISPSASIQQGCFIQSYCNVSANVTLGKCVRLNVGANIMHDSIIADFSVIAPNAVILGKCTVESNAYIGANSTILPNCIVGSAATVGAGAVVTKNVKEHTTVIGVPAKTLRKSGEIL